MKFLDRFRKKSDTPQYETPGYPDGGPFKDESTQDYHARKWRELDVNIKRDAVIFLQEELHSDTLNEWQKEIENDPEDWYGFHHMFGGMQFRNLLRKEIKDARLPTGNWDDYWAAALEAACGIQAIV